MLQIGLSIHLEFLTPVSYIFMAFTSVFVLYKYVAARRNFLVSFFLTILAVITSYLLYPEIRSSIYGSPVDLVYSPVNKLFFFCIPALAGTAYLSDHNALFERMRSWGRLTAVLGIVTFLFVFFYADKKLNYMVYSYFMLLSICVCYEHAGRKHAISDRVIAIMGTVCIVMCGARGAVASLALYFVARVVTRLRKRETRKTVMKSICAILGILAAVFFYREILLVCIALCDQWGINSRFLTSLYSGELIQDSARALILESVMRSLIHNPIGYGLFGDRYAIGSFGYPRYSYAHNIFLEIMCDFGVIGGSVVLVIILWRMARTVRVLKNRPTISLLHVLLPYGFFQLFFSSSFLENTPFFMIMAMLFCVKWKNRLDTQTGDIT